MESITYRKTLQTKPLQDSHTAHVLLTVHTVAAVPAKTAHKNRCAHARLILTQMLLEAKLSPMNLGDQRFSIEIAESEETRIRGHHSGASGKLKRRHLHHYFV